MIVDGAEAAAAAAAVVAPLFSIASMPRATPVGRGILRAEEAGGRRERRSGLAGCARDDLGGAKRYKRPSAGRGTSCSG